MYMYMYMFVSYLVTKVPPHNPWGKRDSGQTGQSGQTGPPKWQQALPEWASDDSTTTDVGTFDSSGTFTSGEKVCACVVSYSMYIAQIGRASCRERV